MNYEQYFPKSVLNIQKHVDGGWFWTKYSSFPYMGCYYGCEYCYWRDEKYNRLAKSHPELSDAFSEHIKIKMNSVELLKKQLKNQEREVIYIDSYQPIETKYRLARKMLQVCDELNFPVFINEKSPLLLKDLDVLKKLSKNYLNVGWSIVFPEDNKAKQVFESRAPSIEARFEAMKQLSKNKIFTGTIMMPILPFITDDEESIKTIIKKTKKNGGKYVLDAGLTLWGYCGTHYYKYLKKYDPKLVSKYKKIYSDKDALGSFYARTHLLVKKYCEKYNILNHIPCPFNEPNKKLSEHFFLKAREIMMKQGPGYKQFAYTKAGWNLYESKIDIKKLFKESGKKGLMTLPGIGTKMSDEIIKILTI